MIWNTFVSFSYLSCLTLCYLLCVELISLPLDSQLQFQLIHYLGVDQMPILTVFFSSLGTNNSSSPKLVQLCIFLSEIKFDEA